MKRYKCYRSSHQRCSLQKGGLRNFTKFTGKHLCQSIFFKKVADLRPATLLKKRLWRRCFPVNFLKFLKTPFLQNTSERLLLMLAEEGFFIEADIVIQSPGYGMESQEECSGEEDGNANHLSSNHFLDEANVRIVLSTLLKKTKSRMKNELWSKWCKYWLYYATRKSDCRKKTIKVTWTQVKLIMTKLFTNNKKRYLSNKKPPILHFNWRIGDLRSREQSNVPKLWRMDELGTPLSLFESYFHDALVTQIVKYTKLYGQWEKGDCSFYLWNEKLRLILGIFLLSGYHKLRHCRMYWETTSDTFAQALSDYLSRNEFQPIPRILYLCDNTKLDNTFL